MTLTRTIGPRHRAGRRAGRAAGRALGTLAIVGLLGTAACSSGSPTGTTSSSGSATASTPSVPTSTASSTSATTTTPTTTSAAQTPTASVTSRAGRPTGSVTVLRTLATGLDVPWGLALMPDRSAVLVTTRDDGRVRRIDLSTGRVTSVGRVPGVVSNVAQQGEAGLLGIAVSPRFASDRTLFVYFSTANDNRIATMTYDPTAPAGQQLGTPRVIVRGIPHGVHHNGGHLSFGPDGYLYATTGESGNPSLSQDRSSLGGKILRMTTSGQPAPGNPFGTLVWSYGHRNVEGIAWDAAGRLWSSEFGDHLHDELNLIRRGGNYGWPQTEGKTSEPGIVSPVEQWSPDVNSPSGIAIAAGSAWLGGLRGERLWRVPLDGAKPAGDPQAFLNGRYGRLRSVLAIDDRTLLVTTSNRDGRTAPNAGDDRILVLRVS
ncbi:PQQ-dependent sugar dehydrogenase [Intrasporangium sp. YIM S08009]|uniref:PQQ-dependent sugar dehydrogenase n=1 Tax=Intrasporangium zincisolvens TaxID=3080018 RepID=UPI002B05E634|nr:PQQ-dependent sugar dehydrogenase [Intrasporangium sp. YIM S08009]